MIRHQTSTTGLDDNDVLEWENLHFEAFSFSSKGNKAENNVYRQRVHEKKMDTTDETTRPLLLDSVRAALVLKHLYLSDRHVRGDFFFWLDHCRSRFPQNRSP